MENCRGGGRETLRNGKSLSHLDCSRGSSGRFCASTKSLLRLPFPRATSSEARCAVTARDLDLQILGRGTIVLAQAHLATWPWDQVLFETLPFDHEKNGPPRQVDCLFQKPEVLLNNHTVKKHFSP